MRRTRFHSLLCLWAAWSTAVTGCRPPAAVVTTPAPSHPTAPALQATPAGAARPIVPIDTAATDGGFVVTSPDPKLAKTDAVITPITPAESDAMFARAEPLPDLTAHNTAAPTMRAPSAPPPRSGPSQPIAFVVPAGKPVADGVIAPGAPPVAEVKPLPPPQISPQDDVRAESEVRIRFSEPMVPVAAVGTPAKAPATITPNVAGSWRWIDTRVVQFTSASPRLPQATEFVVTVPAGARAINGSTLAEKTTATFRTPAVSLTSAYPRTVRPDSAIAVSFDQPIDPAKIIPLLRVMTPKKKSLSFRAIDLGAAQKLWANNPSIAFQPSTAETTLGKHHVLLAPTTAWPAGTELTIELGAGAPSREGPRISKHASYTSFAVAPAFTALGLECLDMARPRLVGALCPAKSYFELQFSNPVQLSTYRSSKVQIDGEPFEDHALSGSSVGLTAPGPVGRTYNVTIGSGLVDVYGQPYVGSRRATFTTGMERFEPAFEVPTGLHILDPRFEIPQWVIATQAVASVRVQLFAVQPTDYFAYEAYEAGERATPPGKRISDKTYPVGARNGADLRVDLRPALPSSGVGHIVAVATAVRIGPKTDWFTPKGVAWIQVTKLGASARVDGEKATLWVRDIAPTSFLTPIGGATASLLVGPRGAAVATATTNALGEASFVLPPAPPPPATMPDRTPSVLLQVQSGADVMFTSYDGNYEQAARIHDAHWYVTDDRFTYKPGEKAYFKGWVRWTHNGVNPELALPAAGEQVTYTLNDARGNKLASGTAPLSDQGGFDIEISLPATTNLGTATLSMHTRDEHHSHPISVQEFRTPPYSVSLNDDVQHRGAVPLILGESIEMMTEAKYFAGGGLTGADVAWSLSLDPTQFRPAGWDRFTFAPPYKRSQSRWDHDSDTISGNRAETLSSASTSSIVIGMTSLARNRPSILRVDAAVTDVDRMTIRASSRPILVHPSAYYVGIRLRPSAAGSGDALEAVVTDLDGSPVAGVPIDIEIEGVLGSERHRDDAKVTDTQRCKLTSNTAPIPCAWTRRDDKFAYVAIARIADARGRVNTTKLEIPWWEYADRVRDLAITPDRAVYSLGDVAKLDIMSKVLPATAIVSFARQGVFAQKRVELTKEITTIELPIEPAFIQNVHVIVDRIGKRRHLQPGSTLPLPEHTSVEINLPVALESARLEMRTRPLAPLVEPGENATFEVEVRHQGKPTPNAEVALIVVDEAILSLSKKKHQDPLAPFYREVAAGTSSASSYGMVYDSGPDLSGVPGFSTYKLDESGRMGFGRSGYGAGGGGLSGRSGSVPTVSIGAAQIKVRKDFRATAVFSPRLRTDANGKVKLTVKMPDSLTRFRIIALATADARYFGKAENVIVSQLKVNARSVAPRFLTQGDQFSLPVVVQNLGATPRTVDVAARAANLEAVGPAGKRITIPAGQRAEVRFEFKTKARGKAIVQTVMVSGDLADASNVELPVYEPATTESFATYGIVDDKPQFEQLAVPASIFPDVGGVEVELASTQLQSLTDAYWYVYAYPYECAEQRSSRMIATSAMTDILDAFMTPGRPTRDEIRQQLARDLRLLQTEQNADGGWGYFSRMHSDPYVSMQVLTAFALNDMKGAVVTSAIAYTRKQADALLTKLEASVKQPAIDRSDRAELPYRVSLAAAALSALAVAGTDIRGRVDRLHAAATALEAYPIDAKARVLALLAKQDRAKAARAKLLTALISATHETAAAATVTASYAESERLLLVSSSKTTALALDAVMREAPEHALIPKLARGLLDGRRRGRWSSTQENVVVLQAMRRYFDTYEKVTPSYTGKLWFGKAAYAEQAFVGRSTKRGTLELDWSTLPGGSSHDLALVKDGPGRMYYRVGITYAPKQTKLEALDAGFIVRRSYTAIDDPADVTQLPDGRHKVRLGARVLVTVAALNTTRRHAVALVDPLPAGFEAVNDNLATAERSVAVADQASWDYINMRDNRSEAFMMQLREGSHRFSYTVRATTPGTFLAAPAKAEEMYSPETFGRSASHVVVIE